MILVNDIMYFFKYDGTLINSTDLSYSINSTYYSLIPYKVENCYLHYIISYPTNELSFGFTYYKFNLNSYMNVIVKEKTISPSIYSTEFGIITYFSGGRCLFMRHPTLNKYIFACFYSIFMGLYPEIQTCSFDPDNDFNELENLFNYSAIFVAEFEVPKNFDIVTDKQNDVINIFFGFQTAYRVTFDFNNYFSDAHLFTEHSIREIYY